jgi:hypothetical protein
LPAEADLLPTSEEVRIVQMDIKLQLTIFFFAVAIPMLLVPLVLHWGRLAANVRAGLVLALFGVGFALSAYLGMHWRGNLSQIVAAQCNDRSLLLLAIAGGVLNAAELYVLLSTIRRSRALRGG